MTVEVILHITVQLVIKVMRSNDKGQHITWMLPVAKPDDIGMFIPRFICNALVISCAHSNQTLNCVLAKLVIQVLL
jgi:hypothetical protein